MRTSALFGAKNCGFFEIYGVQARKRGEKSLSQCGHFSDKEKGRSIFRDAVWTSFMDGPLPFWWTGFLQPSRPQMPLL